ncbi:hypothetical protein DVH24_036695 [Malus domestica]|uniref:Uncharacterized protein n=1 Tax=Malus domestica TaxID=3750 RepID=A0A498IJP6_MALDO|nr:hypothetical protein DVH24_036695 [Malus domestica]
MHSSVKDHPSVSSVTSPVAPSVSKLSSTTSIGKSPRTIFKLDQLWALYAEFSTARRVARTVPTGRHD